MSVTPLKAATYDPDVGTNGAASLLYKGLPSAEPGAPLPEPTVTIRQGARSRLTYVRGIVHEDLATAAVVLGMSVDALGRELPGTSLAEIAGDRHVDPALIADALFAKALLAITCAVQRRVISVEDSVDISGRVLQKICRLLHRRIPLSHGGAGSARAPIAD